MKLKKFVVAVAIPENVVGADVDGKDIADWIIENTETGVGVEVEQIIEVKDKAGREND